MNWNIKLCIMQAFETNFNLFDIFSFNQPYLSFYCQIHNIQLIVLRRLKSGDKLTINQYRDFRGIHICGIVYHICGIVYHICGIVYHVCGNFDPQMWYSIPQMWYSIPHMWYTQIFFFWFWQFFKKISNGNF